MEPRLYVAKRRQDLLRDTGEAVHDGVLYYKVFGVT